MLADHFRAMARNNAWSNHRLLAACGRLSPEAYLAPRIGFFPSIHLTLNHILIVDWYYIDALEAGGLGPRAYEDETPCADLAALETAQREADRRLIAWCDAADEARPRSAITISWTPSLFNSNAAANPAGPAPTIKTSA